MRVMVWVDDFLLAFGSMEEARECSGVSGGFGVCGVREELFGAKGLEEAKEEEEEWEEEEDLPTQLLQTQLLKRNSPQPRPLFQHSLLMITATGLLTWKCISLLQNAGVQLIMSRVWIPTELNQLQLSFSSSSSDGQLEEKMYGASASLLTHVRKRFQENKFLLRSIVEERISFSKILRKLKGRKRRKT